MWGVLSMNKDLNVNFMKQQSESLQQSNRQQSEYEKQWMEKEHSCREDLYKERVRAERIDHELSCLRSKIREPKVAPSPVRVAPLPNGSGAAMKFSGTLQLGPASSQVGIGTKPVGPPSASAAPGSLSQQAPPSTQTDPERSSGGQ